MSKIPENPKGTRTICCQGGNGLMRSAIVSNTTPANAIFESSAQSLAWAKVVDHQRSSEQLHVRIDIRRCSAITVCGAMASVLIGVTLRLPGRSLDDFRCSQRASSRL